MNAIDSKKLEDILITVSRPGRYLGNEWNVCKKDLDKVGLKVALAFPDIYDVGMSYPGFRIIYGVLNSRADVACERVFAPWVDLEGKLRQEGIPLFSLESRVPIRDFDIIGFSLNYELNYTNVLNMLDLAGIPLLAKDRPAGFPLIIAGGPAVFSPEPMSAFFDAFAVGDGEETALEIADMYKEVAGKNKKILLEKLAEIEGVYVPGISKEIKKRIVKDLDGAFYPVKDLVPYVQVIHDRIAIEIMRGCPFGCKFCQASALYKPVRIRSKEKVMQLAREAYKNTGHDEISLLSLSGGHYPGVPSLIADLTAEFDSRGVGVSISSLRSKDILKSLPSIIARTRKTGLTFAPEAGSDRLRKYINKDIDIEDIISACDEAFKSGWRLIKLYFMIGLPTETYQDLEGIPDMVHRILALKRDAHISVSINPFVPKRHTAFEKEPMDDIDTLMAKQKFIRERIRNGRVKLKFHDARISLIEWKLNQPDARLSDVVYGAWKDGAKFDAWSEFFNFNIWAKAFTDVNM